MTPLNLNDPREAGLEILAEWIAEAYLEELEQTAKLENPNNLLKENIDANQRNQRSDQVTTTGENPPGDKKEHSGSDLPGANGLFRVSGRSKKGLRRKASNAAHLISDQ